MSFEIDRQTLRDLEIFGERPQDPSIFRYYNRTKTFGGKLQLKAIMEYPLDNIDEIRERGDTIEFFRDFEFQLTINASQMDFIDHYFRLNKTTLKANFLDVFFNKIWVNPNARNDLYLITTGVEKMIFLLIELEKMLTAAATNELPSKLANTFTFFRDFLQLTEISRMIKEVKAKPHRIRTYKYDRLFRGKYKEETRQIVQAIYAFDAYRAVAETAALKGLAFPEYVESETPVLRLKGLFHPFLEEPIANDIEMGRGQHLCFLSGPNMAGKSTFLKSVGLSVYLSQLGFPVPAKKMTTSIYKGLVTTINLPDNMGLGYSHFYSEVKRVKEVALKIKEKENVLVIFDELFRGTNVKDAYDASLAIIESLADIHRSTFFVSTHITEIAQQLQHNENIQFKFFDTKLVDNQPVYSYRLSQGISHERLGMLIVQNENIIEILKSIRTT